MINTVLFDFVNTIAFLNPLKEDILLQYCQKENNIFLSRKMVEEVYTEIDSILPYSSVGIKSSSDKRSFYQEYNKQLFKRLGIGGFDGFYDFYCSIEKEWALDRSVFEVFKFLKDMKITIGLLSNFDSNLEDVLENLKILNMLDFVVVSAKIGLEKPNIEFYEYAKSIYNINVDETIYVGDSYELDYIPASEAGFTSFLIDRNDSMTKKANRLQSIDKIIEIVNNEREINVT